MLHTLLKADTLIETIRLNMLSKDTVALCFGENGWGVPVWESMATSAEKNATETYLGRMAPVIRAIRLGDDCVTMELGNGLTYPIVREPMATIRIIQRNGNPERDFLAGDLNKAIWRELHAIVVKRVADNGVGGPLALRNLEVGKPFDLWVGGVVTDRKAKVFDALESLFSFPDGLPSDDQLAIGLALYQQGVEFAESTERRLRSAITMYYVALQKGKQRAEEIRAAFRSLKPKERQSLGELTAKAQTDFWSLVEVGQRDLQKFAISDVPMNGNQISYSETAWGKRVLRAASEAYAAACSQETARQLQAFVLGKEELFRPRPNTDEKKETTA
jgi:CRISPR system Cascade subunit CasA